MLGQMSAAYCFGSLGEEKDAGLGQPAFDQPGISWTIQACLAGWPANFLSM
jgi:hypothetical protein